MPNWLKLIISLILPQVAGGTGAYFTITSIESWYQTINKPSFNPPGWLFGPVWTTLYLLMGIACYLIWKSDHPQKKAATHSLLHAARPQCPLVAGFLWDGVADFRFGGDYSTLDLDFSFREKI